MNRPPTLALFAFALLLGLSAFLCFLPWSAQAFDGRARSLVPAQALWLGWAFLMVLAARLGTARTLWTCLGVAATFYGVWGGSFLLVVFTTTGH